jgi:hypothetical protein
VTSVFYLCRSHDDLYGLLFAGDLPQSYYSLGMFVIEANHWSGELAGTYSFLARQGRKTLNLTLKLLEVRPIYMVDADENGIFYFKAIALDRRIKYCGSMDSIFQGKQLYRLEPASMIKLEKACVENDFYFIGSSGSDMRLIE